MTSRHAVARRPDAIYVLRIGLDDTTGQWRASVRVEGAPRRHFTSVDDLMLFVFGECVRCSGAENAEAALG